MEHLTHALLITLSLLVTSLLLVGLAMWGLYRFFQEKPPSDASQKPTTDAPNHTENP